MPSVWLANDALDNTVCKWLDYQYTPLQAFSGANVDVNPRHWQPFGCPVYVLDAALQGDKPYNKWRESITPRALCGTCLQLVYWSGGSSDMSAAAKLAFLE